MAKGAFTGTPYKLFAYTQGQAPHGGAVLFLLVRSSRGCRASSWSRWG